MHSELSKYSLLILDSFTLNSKLGGTVNFGTGVKSFKRKNMKKKKDLKKYFNMTMNSVHRI